MSELWGVRVVDWDTAQRWRAGIERLINRWGAMVEGQQASQAERTVDLVEQIEELRKKVADLEVTIDKCRAAYKELRSRTDD